MDFEKFGSVIIGEHGKLFFNRSSKNAWALKTDSKVDGFQWPAPSLPRATDQNNYREWYDAIQGTIDQGESNFGLAGPMTETILLGVLAQRVPDQKLKWDAEKMEIIGRPELGQFIRRDYADGWNASSLVGKSQFDLGEIGLSKCRGHCRNYANAIGSNGQLFFGPRLGKQLAFRIREFASVRPTYFLRHP
jgi:hypothetical protein